MKLTRRISVFLIAASLFATPQTTTQGAQTKTAAKSASGQLSELPGIGKVYSGKRLQGRPHKGKKLIDKQTLPASVYSRIKDQIIAKQK